MPKMKRWILTTLFFLLVCPTSALAQNITVDGKDNPLKITGWLNEESTLIGSIRLSAPTAVEQFTFLVSDLKLENSNEIIARQQVTFIGEPKLQADIPKDFQVKIANPQLPGTYKGLIEILLPKQKRLVIPLTLLVNARPKLTPAKGYEQIRLNLSQCSWDCLFANWFLQDAAFLRSTNLEFDNSVDAPVKVTNAEVLLKGELTTYPLTSQQIKVVNYNEPLKPNQMVRLTLNWDKAYIPPDRYTGSVYLTLDGAKERLIIPVELNMRVAPLKPLLVLIIGIITGRLVKYLREKAVPQAEASDKVKKLQERIEKVKSEEDRIILKQMTQNVKESVQQMNFETVDVEISKVDERNKWFGKLRNLESRLELFKDRRDVKENILIPILNIREKIINEQDDDVNFLLKELQSKWDELKPDLLKMGDETRTLQLEQVTNAVADINTVASQEKSTSQLDFNVNKQKQPQWLIKLQNIVMFVSGSKFRSQANDWFARPLLSLIILIALTYAGMRALYLQKGATFGADPLDYFGLVFWGLSADVASRSITNSDEEVKEK